jgi:hypothetical protein
MKTPGFAQHGARGVGSGNEKAPGNQKCRVTARPATDFENVAKRLQVAAQKLLRTGHLQRLKKTRLRRMPIVIGDCAPIHLHPVPTRAVRHVALKGSEREENGAGQPSDRILGLGMGTPDAPTLKIHTNFKLVFQRTTW